MLLGIVFCTCLIISNLLAAKIFMLGSLALPAAVIIFPVSYIINDCLTEVYGYRKARLVIWLAFALSAFTAVMSGLVCLLPEPFDEGSKPVAESFNSLFGMVPRTTIASLLAFIAGSTVNAWILSRMKVATGGRAFGVRAVLSSVGGELVDSCIFFPFVFWGMMPLSVIAGMVFTQVVVKTLYELVILPFTSWFVRYLKAKEGVDTYDSGISYNPFKISDIQ